MIAILKDFADDLHEVEIPDDTQVIAGITLSGDMVMIYPIYFDSDDAGRWQDFFDGSWSIERKDFDTIKTEDGKINLTLLG